MILSSASLPSSIPESAYRTYIDYDVAVGYGAFRQYADVERVAVARDSGAVALLHAVFGDAVAAETLRNEAVERGYYRRIFLRAVDFDVAADFVQFVFYGVGRHHFDECRNHLGRILAHLDSVPRVRLVAQTHQSCYRVVDFVSHFIPLLLHGKDSVFISNTVCYHAL